MASSSKLRSLYPKTALMASVDGAPNEAPSIESSFEVDLERDLDERSETIGEEEPVLAQRIVTCGNCKAVYPLAEDALGTGNGARVQCEVCGNVWFQSNNRVNRLFD